MTQLRKAVLTGSLPDVREGVPTSNIVPGEDIPEGLKRERKGPYSRTAGRGKG